MFFYLTLYKN